MNCYYCHFLAYSYYCACAIVHISIGPSAHRSDAHVWVGTHLLIYILMKKYDTFVIVGLCNDLASPKAQLGSAGDPAGFSGV